ncbi:MFS transporter [Melioribacteraceae bacterium 4301-Me]|uniref:MFS transporter n=1 Tax=Pyranulibacter aquaticus TaxID=3163344 RepID=UPI003596C339
MSIKSLPKQVKILGLISFFTDFASEMLYPITPIFLTSFLGASMSLVGLIEGLAELTAGILKGYFGMLSDKIGKRSIFVFGGYSLSAFSKPLPGIFPRIVTVIFSRIADRIGKGMRTSPRDALLSEYSKNNSGAIFGFHRSMDTFGAVAGPIAAIIYLYFHPGGYISLFLIAFIPSVIAIYFASKVRDKSTVVFSKEKFDYKDFWKTAPKNYKIILILLTIFSLVNSSDVFLILKSKYITHSDNYAITGYIFYNIIYAFSSYPSGILSDKFGKKKVLAFGLLIFSFVYFGFAFNNNLLLMFIFFAFYGLYAAATEGISKAWISDIIIPRYKGSAIGLLNSFVSVAVMIGSFGAGVIWDKFGSTAPFLVSAVVSFVVATIFFFMKDENRVQVLSKS